MPLTKPYKDVREFHRAFNHPVSDVPVMLTPERIAVRNSWVEEELRELKEAQNIAEQIDAVVDGIYFLVGHAVEMGVEPSRIFEAVQRANMAKLWPDGKPRYKEDGKVKKPSSWSPPDSDIELEIERQIREARK